MFSGIPYFPLECKLDDKLALIEAEFGLTGFGVVVKLWQKIYSLGYYLEWTNEVGLLFAREVGLGGSSVSEIVSAAIKRGIFDNTMYKKYQILTSAGIQKRYFEAVKRRKIVEVDTRYLLVKVTDFLNPACISGKNVSISDENVDISKQRKEEKRKEEKYPPTPQADAVEKKQPYADYVSMTATEYTALCERIGESGAKRCIEILDNYKGANGKQYKSDYRAILSWVLDRYSKETAQNRALEEELPKPVAHAYPRSEDDILTEIDERDDLASLLRKVDAIEEGRP